jgi:hypothetical protein
MLTGFIQKYKLVLLMGFFALVYGLIAFVNHYCFRTFALDLGVYTNALYDYAHGKWNDATLFKEQPRNLLSDHLDFTLIFLGPISHLLGQYTLQFAQICFVLLGGLGIYKFLLEKNVNSTLAFIGALHFFFVFWDICRFVLRLPQQCSSGYVVALVLVVFATQRFCESDFVFPIHAHVQRVYSSLARLSLFCFTC